jgi:prepilin-type N-terminal cleavage/methylation domain-containing protein
MRKKGFTLIELLIVVAIIAILAAIAVPNFLEAQVRSKVSRGHADMRTIATGIESYKVDTNQYPMDYQFYQWGGGDLYDPFADCCLGRLTTPIAFLTTLPKNVFEFKRGAFDGDSRWYGYKADNYWREIVYPGILSSFPNADFGRHWVLISVGPDQQANNGEYAMFGMEVLESTTPFMGGGYGCIYDPTNGTVSSGDLVRVGP